MTRVSMDRFLITTADERSWKFDRPVLFLGEWCRVYDRKRIWQAMDATVAEPYGLQVWQKERDFAYVQAVSNRLMDELTDALNAFHNTRHSLRFWNIVLGHWLRRYVAGIFNRYATLEQALANYKVSCTTIFDSTHYSLATANSMYFIYASVNDIWNHVLYARILNFWGKGETEIDSLALQGIRGFKQQGDEEAVQRMSVKRRIVNVANMILPKFSRKRDAFIVNSYLPLKEEIKLQLSLGQCPQLWRSPALKNAVFDSEKRQRFRIDVEPHTGFERFVRSQLGDSIPICYLEGYDQLVHQVKCLPWPGEPKFIFTSNNFDTDEIFKVWTGSKVEKGIPYFTGQHGGSSGAHVVAGNSNWPERASADKVLTWGWIDENTNDVPAFIFRTAARKPRQFDRDGGLLLVENLISYSFQTYDDYYEYKLYQDEQFRFVESLPAHICRELTVRLHHGLSHMAWFGEQRWKNRSPHTRIETGLAKIHSLIARSRLVVHSYDSTGSLETLALDIPTLCFWQGGLDHILPGAKPYYELLRSAGILADTPEQAARLIASHWDDVGGWWESTRVQDARSAFCEQFARTEKDPVRTMKRLLTAHEKTLN